MTETLSVRDSAVNQNCSAIAYHMADTFPNDPCRVGTVKSSAHGEMSFCNNHA